MAAHALTAHFAKFFGRLNPSPSFGSAAARDHSRVTTLIENRLGPAGVLAPECFLQGSYKQDTAIYTINDVDIVALCALWQPGANGGSSPSWSRNDIFAHVAAAIEAGGIHLHYGSDSMVIKVNLDTNIEVLPVVYRAGNSVATNEPFRLWRPERQAWQDGYARNHQRRLTIKNTVGTGGNFKPMIKVLKHLRSRYGLDSVSFHLECLLYSLPNELFVGSAADYIGNVLAGIAGIPVESYDTTALRTPCGDRDIFTHAEWERSNWQAFHAEMSEMFDVAEYAAVTTDRAFAIRSWQAILGKDFFPAST